MRVLIVDDHEIVRRGLKQTLAESFAGTAFGEAASTPDALALLQRTSWDVAIIDVNIPGSGGLWLLEEARRLYPKLRVLVVTAYPEEEFGVRCLRLGAAGFLTKESAADELVVAIKKILGGGRYITASLAEHLASVMDGSARATPHEALSTRELQVLRLVAVGRSQKEIASELRVSEKTVGTYRERIAEKLGVSTNVELTRYALQHKLVD